MADGRLPVFVGPGSQRGYGLGGMLSGLFRTAMPMLRKGALRLGKEVGKQALTTGAGILEDVMAGENIKRAAARRAKAAGLRMKREALNQARAAIAKQVGRGRGQRGRGKRIINRSARTRTVITTKDTKKNRSRPRRPTRGRKGIKLPRRLLSDTRLNAYVRQHRTRRSPGSSAASRRSSPYFSPVSPYTPPGSPPSA